MEPQGDAPPLPVTREPRTLLAGVLAGLVAAAVVIGAGSAATDVAGAVPAAPGPAVALLLRTLTLVVGVLGAAVVALFVYALWPSGPRPSRPSRPIGLLRPLLVLCLAALVGVLLVRGGIRPFGGPGGSPFGGAVPRPTAMPGSGDAAGGLGWWLPLSIVGSLAVAAAAAGWYVLRPRRGREVTRPDGAADAGFVEESLDVLEREPDPRRAVIRAYAAMEASFGTRGLPRRPFEAPLEYLERALGQLRVGPTRVAELAELFELARFSHHPIGEGHRTAAIDLLRAIRQELAA